MRKVNKINIGVMLISGLLIILCSIFWDIYFLLAFIPTVIVGCGMLIENKICKLKVQSNKR